MNPYERYVEGRDPFECLVDTPRRIEGLVRGWPAAGFAQSYAPGKWPARQLLIHLAHVEMVAATRLRFALAQDGYVVQPFEQDDWMRVESDGDGESALATYLALRRMTAALCRGLSPAQRARSAMHPDFGPITVEWIVAWLTGHELHHVPQLEAIGKLAGPA